MKRALLYLFSVVALMGAVQETLPKSRTIRTTEGYFNFLDSSNEAVVMFYKGNDANAQRLLSLFHDVSESYRDEGIKFAAIDVGQPALSKLDDNFEQGKMPLFVYFREGTPVRGKGGEVVVLSGAVSRASLKQFIDGYHQDEEEETTTTTVYEKPRTKSTVYYYSSPYYSSYPYYSYGYGWPFYGSYGYRWGGGRRWGGGYRGGYRGGFRGGFRGGRGGGFRGGRGGGLRGGRGRR